MKPDFKLKNVLHTVLILHINLTWKPLSGEISVLWPHQGFEWWLIRGKRKLLGVCLCVREHPFAWHLSLCVHATRSKNRCSTAMSVLLSKHSTCHGHKYSYRSEDNNTTHCGFYKRPVFVAEICYDMQKHRPDYCCWCHLEQPSLTLMPPGLMILHPWYLQLTVYPKGQIRLLWNEQSTTLSVIQYKVTSQGIPLKVSISTASCLRCAFWFVDIRL